MPLPGLTRRPPGAPVDSARGSRLRPSPPTTHRTGRVPGPARGGPRAPRTAPPALPPFEIFEISVASAVPRLRSWRHRSHRRGVAQRPERRSPKPDAAGSTPASPATFRDAGCSRGRRAGGPPSAATPTISRTPARHPALSRSRSRAIPLSRRRSPCDHEPPAPPFRDPNNKPSGWSAAGSAPGFIHIRHIPGPIPLTSALPVDDSRHFRGDRVQTVEQNQLVGLIAP